MSYKSKGLEELYNYIMDNIEFINTGKLKKLLKEHELNCIERNLQYKFHLDCRLKNVIEHELDITEL